MSQNEIINIGATFSEHFEIVPALSEELKMKLFVYAIRSIVKI